MMKVPEGPLSKVYRMKQLARAGIAACDSANSVEDLPLALEVIFETINALAADVFDELESAPS